MLNWANTLEVYFGISIIFAILTGAFVRKYWHDPKHFRTIDVMFLAMCGFVMALLSFVTIFAHNRGPAPLFLKFAFPVLTIFLDGCVVAILDRRGKYLRSLRTNERH